MASSSLEKRIDVPETFAFTGARGAFRRVRNNRSASWARLSAPLCTHVPKNSLSSAAFRASAAAIKTPNQIALGLTLLAHRALYTGVWSAITLAATDRSFQRHKRRVLINSLWYTKVNTNCRFVKSNYIAIRKNRKVTSGNLYKITVFEKINTRLCTMEQI